MYKITFPDGNSVLTEKPNFIRVHKENCFIICAREKAEGVVYHGGPFLFADGTRCYEVDSGDEFAALKEEDASIYEQLAQADETAIELYEAQMEQEEINTAQDDALIEIYELIGG